VPAGKGANYFNGKEMCIPPTAKAVGLLRKFFMRKEPVWEEFLSSASRFQKILPEAILVEEMASDAERVLPNLREQFHEVLRDLESVAGRETGRIKRSVLILGKLDGIDTGILQFKRKGPLETETIEVADERILVPTIGEILRIKGILILRRNAARDYLDFSVLADALGKEKVCRALANFDALYPQKNGESALMQLQIQLSYPLPYDLEKTNLLVCKHFRPEWQEWETIKSICIRVSLILSAELERPYIGADRAAATNN
jgi:hypothetical protein